MLGVRIGLTNSPTVNGTLQVRRLKFKDAKQKNKTALDGSFGFISSSASGSHSAVYHYQFRIQFVNQMERIQPSLTISLSGTKEESGDLPITM